MPATIDELERRLVTLEEERQRREVQAVGDPRIPLLATGFDVEEAIFAPHSLYVIKGTLESLASDITLQDDDELFFPMGSHETWVYEFFILWRAHVDGDIRFTLTVPSGAGGAWAASRQVGTADREPTYLSDIAFGSPISILADATDEKRGIHIFGTVISVAADGNVVFQWAQNSSSGTATIVYNSSWLRATKIS